MSRLSFFLLGLACGVALTTLRTARRDPISQSKQLNKGLDHESQINQTAQLSLPFVVVPLASSIPATIVVDRVAARSSQMDILIRTYRTADDAIAITNKPLTELLYGN